MSKPLQDQPQNLCLLLIDVQERLCAAMDKTILDRNVQNMLHLLKLAEIFEIPVLVTEQYPKGLGPTLPELAHAVPGFQPIEKMHFSCCKSDGFKERLKALNRSTIVVVGMETHICVLQTVRDLVHDFSVVVPADAVVSRKKLSWEIGLRQMEQYGAVLSTTETILFSALNMAGTEAFKTISKRLR